MLNYACLLIPYNWNTFIMVYCACMFESSKLLTYFYKYCITHLCLESLSIFSVWCKSFDVLVSLTSTSSRWMRKSSISFSLVLNLSTSRVSKLTLVMLLELAISSSLQYSSACSNYIMKDNHAMNTHPMVVFFLNMHFQFMSYNIISF